jgi:hypothetical protein
MYRRDSRQCVRDRIVDAEIKKLELRQTQARLHQSERPARQGQAVPSVQALMRR